MRETLNAYLQAIKNYHDELGHYLASGGNPTGDLKRPERMLTKEALNHLEEMKMEMDRLHEKWIKEFREGGE